MRKKVKQFRNISQARQAYSKYSPTCGIYCFESKTRRTVYIGMSENLAVRFSAHKKSYSDKHGEHRRLHEFFDTVGYDRTPVKVLLEAPENSRRFTRRELYVIESLLVEIYLSKGYEVLNNEEPQRLSKFYYRDIGVKQFTRNGNLKQVYRKIYDLIEIYGFDTLQILRCCKGEIKSRLGYQWLVYNNKQEYDHSLYFGLKLKEQSERIRIDYLRLVQFERSWYNTQLCR